MSKKKVKQVLKDTDMENQEVEVLENDDNEVVSDVVEEVTPTVDTIKDVIVSKKVVEEIIKPMVATPTIVKKEVEELHSKLDLPVDLSPATTKLLNTLVEEKNDLSINTIRNVLTYVKNMAPGQPVEATSGNKQQLDLYRSIVYMINNDSVSNFPLVYGLLLKIVDEFSEKGAFAPTHVFRFVNETHTNKEEIKGFNSLMNLLTATASNINRSNSAKMINFDRTLAIGFTDLGKARVLNFYSK